jgi:hypothetical protein
MEEIIKNLTVQQDPMIGSELALEKFKGEVVLELKHVVETSTAALATKQDVQTSTAALATKQDVQTSTAARRPAQRKLTTEQDGEEYTADYTTYVERMAAVQDVLR